MNIASEAKAKEIRKIFGDKAEYVVLEIERAITDFAMASPNSTQEQFDFWDEVDDCLLGMKKPPRN